MLKHIVTLLLCLISLLGWSQKQDSLSVQEALTLIEQSESIRFSYDPELLSILVIRLEAAALDLEGLIDLIESSTPLRFQKASDTYFSIFLDETTYELTLSDATKKELIDNLIVAVNGLAVPVKKKNDRWLFTFSPSQKDTVSLHSIGFDNYLLTFQDLINSISLDIALRPTVIELEDLVIHDYLTRGIDLDPANQNISIKTENLPLLPGETDGDIFASIGALPGITNPDNRPGNIFIRGSSTDQSLILYNDIPIYHRGHYYGTISPYNPRMVSEVKVFRNGFDPSIGGRVGGAIKIDSKLDYQNNETIGLGANTLYGTGYLKQASKNKKWSFGIGARKAFPYSWNSPKLQAISDMVFAATAITDSRGDSEIEKIVFEDFSGGVSFRPNQKHNISYTGLYTRSRIEFTVLNSLEYNELTNIGTNVKWNYQMNEYWNSSLSLIFSDYSFDSQTSDTPIDGFPLSINTINDISLTEALSHETTKGNEINTGFQYTYQEVDFKYANLNVQNDEYYKNYQNDHSSTLSIFANYEWKSHPKFYLQSGVRGNYYTRLEKLNLSPRLFFNYFVNDQLTLKTTSGLYYQYLSQVKGLEFVSGGFDNELWQLANGKTAEIISGTQSMIGGIFNKKGWVFDAEGYYKTTRNVSFYSISRFSKQGYFFDGDQKMYGVDLMIKKHINEQMDAWAAYSYSRSFILLDTVARLSEITSQYSQPNVFNIGTSLQMGNLKTSIGWYFASGQFSRTLKIIQVNENTIRLQQQNPTASDDNPFDDLPLRYPNVHQLNLSASYKIPKNEKHKWSGSIGLSLLNLYNQKNQTDTVVRAGTGADATTLLSRYSIGFAPNLMVIVEW